MLPRIVMGVIDPRLPPGTPSGPGRFLKLSPGIAADRQFDPPGTAAAGGGLARRQKLTWVSPARRLNLLSDPTP